MRAYFVMHVKLYKLRGAVPESPVFAFAAVTLVYVYCHLDVPISVEEDVSQLEIAMDDLVPM